MRLPERKAIRVLLFAVNHSAGIVALAAIRDRIVVGSKNFTESYLLGELIAQQIEAHTKLAVERRFYLAGTYICQQAMLAGRSISIPNTRAPR